MSRCEIALPQARFGRTSRPDAWWLQPVVVFLVLSAFVVYTTWAAFQGKNYFYGGGGAHYLSPFYSPLLFGQAGEPRWFAATQPSWWPSWAPFSPALLILIVPGAFRFTCYYYRGAYYKAFWADPPACGVGEPRRGYWGENRLPLLLQNIHRYVFYAAAIFVATLAWDAIRSFWFTADDASHHFGIGLGSIILTVNAFLLGGYTFGCHCARHRAGGHLNSLAARPVHRACYTCVSALNRRHMLWAWVSLIWVALSDLYVRLLASGVLEHDPRIVF